MLKNNRNRTVVIGLAMGTVTLLTFFSPRELLAAAAPHEIEWKWVRGHAGDVMNERADVLATRAREALR